MTKQEILEEAMTIVRDFVYKLRDEGYDIPEARRVELEQFIKKFGNEYAMAVVKKSVPPKAMLRYNEYTSAHTEGFNACHKATLKKAREITKQ